MPEFSLQKFRFVLQAILFFCLLSALLFSRGEGIRLFPFPADDAQRVNAEWKGERDNDYQKNIHRFDNQKGNCQSKSERSHHHAWANVSDAFKHPGFFTANHPDRDFSGDDRFFQSRLLTENTGSRAPPFSL